MRPDTMQFSGRVLYLTEDMVKPPYEADDMYGWAKLMTELGQPQSKEGCPPGRVIQTEARDLAIGVAKVSPVISNDLFNGLLLDGN